jgi:hypothetical protein
VSAGTWYVKTGRTAVNWGTDVSGGVAQVDIAKLVVGTVNEQWFLFARAGQAVTTDQVTAAQAETTGGAVPAALTPSNGVAPGGTNTYAQRAGGTSSSAAPLPFLNVRDFGAKGDGTTDDAPAIRSAIAAIPSGGGTVYFPPGTYRSVATSAAQFISVGNRTTLLGVRGSSIISLDTDVPGAYREFARFYGDNITLDGLTIQRGADFQCVLIRVMNYIGLTLRNCTIDGKRGSYSTNYCHGLQWPQSGTASGVVIDSCVFQGCSNCTLMTNSSTATLTGVVIRNSRMGNVDFNCPAATVSDIYVDSCVIDGTGSTAFGVAFAFTSHAKVSNCTIKNFPYEAIHVEDFSSDITFSGNSIYSNATDAAAPGVIQIISGSTRIRFIGNDIDATTNTNATAINIFNILQGGGGLTPGGRTSAAPNNIVIAKNHIRGGNNNATNGMYLENTTACIIDGNVISSNGGVNSGAYTGPVRRAMYLYNNTTTLVTGNVISGWFYGVLPHTSSIQAGAYGGTFLGNSFRSCQIGLSVLNALPMAITGNTFYNCVSPLLAGSGSSTGAFPVTITGNHAHGCTYPMSIGARTVVRVSTGATTQTVGTGKTLSVLITDQYLPSGTVLTFSGGGTFTLASAATAQVTSLSGTITGASIAAGEIGTAVLAYSPVSAQNKRLLIANGDSNALAIGGYTDYESGATTDRPTASLAGAGGRFYDTTIGKPIWSDGTNWKDAAGNTV